MVHSCPGHVVWKCCCLNVFLSQTTLGQQCVDKDWLSGNFQKQEWSRNLSLLGPQVGEAWGPPCLRPWLTVSWPSSPWARLLASPSATWIRWALPTKTSMFCFFFFHSASEWLQTTSHVPWRHLPVQGKNTDLRIRSSAFCLHQSSVLLVTLGDQMEDCGQVKGPESRG